MAVHQFWELVYAGSIPATLTMRRIHIDKKVFNYKVGDSFVVIIDVDSQRRHNVWLNLITLETWDQIERAKHKKCWRGVKPSQVRSYIIGHLLK